MKEWAASYESQPKSKEFKSLASANLFSRVKQKISVFSNKNFVIFTDCSKRDDFRSQASDNLNVENNSAGYEATFIITPEHHPEVTKSVTL